MLDFYAHNRQELEGFLQTQGFSVTHAKRLYQGSYKKAFSPPQSLAGLPVKLTSVLATEFNVEPLTVATTKRSAYDGSVKFLFRLSDGGLIESVLMPESRRITVCLSTQVGCAQACSFCHTGRMGLKRNLNPGEIVAQIVWANKWIKTNPDWLKEVKTKNTSAVTHVVFMGMGEPLDNVENLIHAISIMRDPLGLDLALRHISVSTAGHLDGLRKLLARFPKIPVAFSLHATTDKARSKLMPINRRWPLAELLAAIRDMGETNGNPVLIQYTVIDQVNDSQEEAKALADLLKGLKVKVNLIPLNEIDPARFSSPTPERLNAFRDVIHKSGQRVMIRYSKGQDIAAACGQLVV